MSFRHRYSWAFLIIFSLSSLACGQRSPAGYVHGRVKSLLLGAGIANARLSVRVRRGDRDEVVKSGGSDERGAFRIRAGAMLGQPRLRIEADGLAPREIVLKSLKNAEGLLLPDIILDPGVSVGLEVDASLASAAPIWVHAFSLQEDQRLIDLETEPLLKGRFGQDGRLVFPHMAPGLYGFVVTDYFARFRPELIVWRVGLEKVHLPPVLLRGGHPLELTMPTGGSEVVEGQLIAGFGRWPREGGEEYRFRTRLFSRGDGKGKAKISIEHLPPSVCRIDLETKGKVATFELLPGSEIREVVWEKSCSVRGQLSSPLGRLDWESATLVIGGRRIKVDKAGRFYCQGMLPGRHKVFAQVPGAPSISNRLVVLASGESRSDFLLRFESGSRVSGETRNKDLKRQSYVWVGYQSVGDDIRFLGTYYQGISDGQSNYEISGISAGHHIFYLRAEGNSVSRFDEIDLEDGVAAAQNLRLIQGGFGKGEIKWPDGSPVARARVQLVEQPVPLKMVLTRAFAGTPSTLKVVETLTDDNGTYSMEGIRPGSHLLVIRPRHGANEVGGTVSTSAGENRSGFDWQVNPPEPLTLDLPVGTPMCLKSQEHSFIERWLYRRPEDGPVEVHCLPRGTYVLSPLALHESNWPLAKKNFNYVEWQGTSLESLASTSAMRAIKVVSMPDLLLSEVEIRLFIGGEFPLDQEKVELTAYPLGASRPLQPVRLEYPSKLSHFKLSLPRGLWLIEARALDRGRGNSGPFSLARGFESSGHEHSKEPLTIDLLTSATVFGFVDLKKGESESGAGVSVSAHQRHDELIRPWRRSKSIVPLSETGELRFERLPPGPSYLRVFGDAAYLDVPLDCEPYDQKDIRRLVPGLPAALVLDLPDMEIRDSAIFGQDSSGPLDDRAFLLPGTYGIRSPSLWYEKESTGIWSSTQVVNLASGDVAIGENTLRKGGRSSLRGDLRVDATILSHWPVTLFPIQNDAHDVSRPIVRGRSDADGVFRFSGLASGEYAFQMRYRDEFERPYNLTFPLFLDDRALTTKQNIRLRTRSLTVIAFDQGEGAPGARALVRILRTDLRGLGATTVFRRRIEEVARGLTDDTGEVIFRSLPIGTYDIVVTRRGRVATVTKGVDLSSGSGAILVRAPGEKGKALGVLLQDDEGNPIEGATCFLYSADDMRVHGDILLQSDKQGRVLLCDLAEGTYRFYMQSPDFPTQRLDDLVVEKTNPEWTTRWAQPGADLEVLCVDSEGRHVEGVQVFLESEAGTWERFGPQSTLLDERINDVNAFGTLMLRNIPQGTCKLRAVHNNFHTFTGDTEIRAARANKFTMILKRKL